MTKTYHWKWQWRQSDCHCPFHRFPKVYLCACGEIVPHEDRGQHENHGGMVSAPSDWFKHGDTYLELYDRLHVFGRLNYGSPGWRAVFAKVAQLEEELERRV